MKDDEVQVVAERPAEAFVTIGKRFGFARRSIAAALVPSDERFADIDHRHADAMSAVLPGEVFGGC